MYVYYYKYCISLVDASCHAQFIDVLMKTYTSEAVFLLTTFVNMARSRTADNDEEIMFINTITEEIFQVSKYLYYTCMYMYMYSTCIVI